MKELNYGKDYRYAHDYDHAYVSAEYLPEPLQGKGLTFYEPTDRGYEKTIGERMAYWKKLRRENMKKGET